MRIIEIPTWAKAFTLILLVQSSSAAEERVFSLYFSHVSLEDIISISVMLQYNRKGDTL